MKLTEDDIEIYDSSVGFSTGKAYTLSIYNLDEDKLKQIKHQILENQRLRKLVEEEIKHHEKYYPYSTDLHVLQSLLNKAKYGWKERHYKIVQESNEKFKTHTEENEIDI